MSGSADVRRSLALKDLIRLSDTLALEYRVSPVELLMFAAAFAVMPHLTADEAHVQFAEARNVLAAAGVPQKK